MQLRDIGTGFVLALAVSSLQSCSNGADNNSSLTPKYSLLSPQISPIETYNNSDLDIRFKCENSSTESCADVFYRIKNSVGNNAFNQYDPLQGLSLPASQYANRLVVVEYYATNFGGSKTRTYSQNYVIDNVAPKVSYSVTDVGASLKDVTITCEDPTPTIANVTAVKSGCKTLYYKFIPSTGTVPAQFNSYDLATSNNNAVVEISQSGKIRYYVEDEAKNQSTETDTNNIDIPPSLVPGLTSLSATGDLASPKITLDWTYPNDTTISRLVICRSETDVIPNSNCDGQTPALDINKTVDAAVWTAHSADDTNIALYKTYYYTGYLFDDSNQVSPPLTKYAVAGNMNPAQTVSITAMTPGDKQISLHWSNPNSGDPSVQVEICRSTSAFPDNTCTPINSTLASTGIYLDSGLVNGTSYFYSLFSVGANGVRSAPAKSSASPFDNVPPAAVSAITHTAYATRIDLSWSNPVDAAVVKVTNTTTGSIILNQLGSQVSDSGLTSGSAYTYEFIVYDAAGNPSTKTSYSASTIVDTGAPTVSSVTPLENSTNVSAADYAKGISVTFSENVSFTNGTTPFTLTADTATFTGTPSVAANVLSFVLDDTVPYLNTTYNASVQTSVTDLSGNALAAPYSWSFTTADGDYTVAVAELSDAPAPNALLAAENFPKLAMDGNGNAIAVWLGDGKNIFAKRYDVNAGWDTTQKQLNIAATDANRPHIAMDHAGNALLVWLQNTPNATLVYGMTYSPSNGWGQAAPIQDTAISATYHDVALDDLGNAFVVWVDANYDVFVRRVGLFDTWSSSAASLPSVTYAVDRTTPYAATPSIAASSNGNAVAIWKDQIFSGTTQVDTVFTRRYSFANSVGSWDTSATRMNALNDGSTDEMHPSIAMDGTGNAIAAWRIQQLETAVSRFDVGSNSWSTPTIYNPTNTNTVTLDSFTSVAMNNTGQAVIAFNHLSAVYVIDYTPASLNNGVERWGTPTAISTNSFAPKTAIDKRGNALIVWADTAYDVYSNRFSVGNTPDWTITKSIRTSTLYDPNTTVSLAMDDYGRAFVVWDEFKLIDAINTNSTVYARRFE